MKLLFLEASGWYLAGPATCVRDGAIWSDSLSYIGRNGRDDQEICGNWPGSSDFSDVLGGLERVHKVGGLAVAQPALLNSLFKKQKTPRYREVFGGG